MSLRRVERRERPVQVTENAPAHGTPGSFVSHGPKFLQQCSQLLIGRPNAGFERGDRGCTVGNDAVPPAFGAGEQAFASPVIRTERRERAAYRRRIDLTHQLADELLLPAQSAARRDACRGTNGAAQIIADRQRLEVAVVERDQLFAEFLAFQIVTLARAFAGL